MSALHGVDAHFAFAPPPPAGTVCSIRVESASVGTKEGRSHHVVQQTKTGPSASFASVRTLRRLSESIALSRRRLAT
jgi:hypothetical protein